MIAAIAALIKGQPNAGTFQTISPGAFANNGRVHFPGHRGFLLLNPGDYIGVDSFGWPIVVSSQSIASGSTSWTHNP